MATSTPNLGLLKKDPVTDGKDTYNIKTMLNDNWDKLDADSAKKALKAANPTAGNLAALDASGNPIDSGKKVADFEAAGAAQSKIDTHNTAANAHSALFETKLPSSAVVGKDIIVTGTYTGDGAASRSITLGFSPSFVLVIPNKISSSNGNAHSSSFGMATQGNPYMGSASNAQIMMIADSNGFMVKYINDGTTSAPALNAPNYIYNYLAGRRVTV